MIWFQIITLPLIAVLLLRSVVELLRGVRPRAPWIAAVLVWALAAVAVTRPEWTTQVAVTMGIGRGADLVLYLLVIAFLGACFYFYNQTHRLESHLTHLARHLAIQDGLQRWPASNVRTEHTQKSRNPDTKH